MALVRAPKGTRQVVLGFMSALHEVGEHRRREVALEALAQLRATVAAMKRTRQTGAKPISLRAAATKSAKPAVRRVTARTRRRQQAPGLDGAGVSI